MCTKPVEQSDALIINRITLRGPEMQLLWEYLGRDGPKTRGELRERFTPLAADDQQSIPESSDVVGSAVDMLWTLELVQVDGRGDDALVQTLRDPRDIDFSSLLLSRLRGLPARQAAFMDLYRWCVTDRRRGLVPSDLLNAARTHVQFEGTWTEEKVRFWVHLATFVGIVQPIRGGILIAPRPSALESWLKAVCPEARGWALDVFRGVDDQFAPCLVDRNELHSGWSETLHLLVQRGRVTLHSGDDAPSYLRAHLPTGTATYAEIRLADASLGVGREA